MTDKDGQTLDRATILSKVVRRLQAYWLELVTGFLWWGVGFVPFHCVRRFFYRLSGMKIGHHSTIHMQARIFDPRFISIGDDTIIGERVTLDGRQQLPGSTSYLKIGNHVDIASEVMIWNSEHDLESETWSAREESVIIEDYVFVGPRVIILPGVTIHRGAVIAAGAVVTRDVGEREIVGGVPAQNIGERHGQLNYHLGRYRLWQ